MRVGVEKGRGCCFPHGTSGLRSWLLDVAGMNQWVEVWVLSYSLPLSTATTTTKYIYGKFSLKLISSLSLLLCTVFKSLFQLKETQTENNKHVMGMAYERKILKSYTHIFSSDQLKTSILRRITINFY